MKEEMSVFAVGKGATAKMPSYLKKIVGMQEGLSDSDSAAEEILFGKRDKNASS